MTTLQLFNELPPIVPAVFRFQATADADALRFFTGPKWYALFCQAIGLDERHDLSDTGIIPSPLDIGSVFFKDEEVRLLVCFCGHNSPEFIAEQLRSNEVSRVGRREYFTDCFKFIGYEVLLPSGAPSVTPELLKPEIDALVARDEFSISFDTPFRINAERSAKSRKLQPVQPDDLTISKILRACWIRLNQLSARWRGDSRALNFVPPTPEPYPPDIMSMPSERLLFLDVPYDGATRDNKVFGGIIGQSRVRAKLSPFWATVLLTASHLRIGQKISFGLGRFSIPEARSVSMIPQACSAANLSDRAARLKHLELEKAVCAIVGPNIEPLFNALYSARRFGMDNVATRGGFNLGSKSQDVEQRKIMAAELARIDLNLLENRLFALLGKDPIVEQLMCWVRLSRTRNGELSSGAAIARMLSVFALPTEGTSD